MGCGDSAPSPVDVCWSSATKPEFMTSSAPITRHASLMAFVSTTQVKPFPWAPPVRRPSGPLRSCSIIHPAFRSLMPYVAATLALTCGLTLAMKILPSCKPALTPSVFPSLVDSSRLAIDIDGCESSAFRTSLCDWSDTSTASADVTHPEHARQSVNEICAGGRFSAGSLSSVVTS